MTSKLIHDAEFQKDARIEAPFNDGIQCEVWG